MKKKRRLLRIITAVKFATYKTTNLVLLNYNTTNTRNSLKRPQFLYNLNGYNNTNTYFIFSQQNTTTSTF